jgi:hypothetical protein
MSDKSIGTEDDVIHSVNPAYLGAVALAGGACVRKSLLTYPPSTTRHVYSYTVSIRRWFSSSQAN